MAWFNQLRNDATPNTQPFKLRSLPHQILLGVKADTELANAAGERPIDLARALLASPGEFDDPATLEKMIALLQVATSL